LVQKALAAFGQGDLETAVSCFAADVAIQHPMPKEIWPWCGRSSGRRALANFMSEMSRVLSFEVFEAREFIAQGGRQGCGQCIRAAARQGHGQGVRQRLRYRSIRFATG
jgi:hypothetical protein